MALGRVPCPRSTTPRRRRAWSLFAAALLLAGAPPVAASDSEPRGRYLVVLADRARPASVAAEHERRYAGEVTHVYRHALRGYAAELPDEAVAAIARDSRVTFVEPDPAVSTLAQNTPTGIRRIFTPSNEGIDIDEIDDVRVDADIAIIDTGIDSNHRDLHVVTSVSCVGSGSFEGCVEGAGHDDNGHGTHVAGTAAALDNDLGVVGVAPGARLHAVKVLTASGIGLTSDVIAGIEWVTARSDTIEVANMSLGCECKVAALDLALVRSVEAGVVHVVSAGNDDHDARDFSPAGHPDVITVSALADFDGAPGGEGVPGCRSDDDDTLADFSNWGPAVDVVAPGVCIRSTSTLGGYKTLSGTSMASPHVAGAAAVVTSGANDPRDRGDVDEVKRTIVGAGNLEWVDDSGDGTAEPLLDVGNANVFVVNSEARTLGTGPPASGNSPPTASFTHTCSTMTCSFDATASSDSDGTISEYEWNFGDGSTGSGETATKTYDDAGSYTVSLTVTDDDGDTTATSEAVSVSPDSGGGSGDEGDFRLMASGGGAGRTVAVYLEWYGTDRVGAMVIYRDGVEIATTADDGSYTDIVEAYSGPITYRACEEGTTRCSNEKTIF